MNHLEDELRLLLRLLHPGLRLQVRWTVDSDFRQPLLDYYAATESLGCEGRIKHLRNERFVSNWNALEARKLRRERLHLFVTMPVGMESDSGGEKSKGGYGALLDAGERAVDEWQSGVAPIIGRLGGSIDPLDDLGHFKECFRFYNPSVDERNPSELEGMFDPLESIQANCFLSDPAPSTAPCGFFMDGYHHALLVLRSLPSATFSGMIRQLTGLDMLDYEITVNIRALDALEEINRAEAEAKKLENAILGNPRTRMRAALELKLNRIRRLISNEVLPFKFQFILRAWAKSSEELLSKIAALKSAVAKLQGAKAYDPAFPTTSRNYFESSHPGWSWSKYEDNSLYVEDHHLANLLPFSGSQAGDLVGAEAIYEGSNRNLIGVCTFSSGNGSRWPKHALFTGKTGSGKSVLLADLLAQTTPYYEFTAIIDNGRSHEDLGRAIGGEDHRPLIVEPNGGDVTFNYLDTQGLPLSPHHISDATAVIEMMIGKHRDEERNRFRAALISRSLEHFYRDCYEQWLSDNPEEQDEIARLAVALTRLKGGGTLAERSLMLEKMGRADEEEHGRILSEVGDEEVARFASTTPGAELIYLLSFSLMQPEQCPTHRQFQQWLELESMGDRKDAGELEKLATLLHPWRADQGRYGSLLDGASNLSFGGGLVHIELGQIPESAAELKTLVAFLITNYLRNEIIRRPAEQRKRVVIEELGAFLAMPDGGKTVREFYERMRKHSCWVAAVIQQSQCLDESGVSASLFGNSRMAFLLKQTDRSEIENIGEIYSLPEPARLRLGAFREPSAEAGAPFLVVNHGGDQPEIFEGINRTSLVQPTLAPVTDSTESYRGSADEEKEGANSSGNGEPVSASDVV